MNENLSLADVAAVTNGNGYGEGIWILLLIALLGGGNFGGYGRGAEQYATSADVQRGFDTSEILRKEDEIKNGLSKGICDSSYALNSQIMTEGRQLSSQLADCCCTTQRNIDSVRFDMSNYACDIKATDTANTQKILDAIAQNKIETLQSRINQLELQSAMCGVVRYPNVMAYNAGPSPFCNCGYGCGCGNI